MALVMGNTYDIGWVIDDGDTDYKGYTLQIEEKDSDSGNDMCSSSWPSISSEPGRNSVRITLPDLHDMDCAIDGSFPEFRFYMESDCDYGYSEEFRVVHVYDSSNDLSLYSDYSVSML